MPGEQMPTERARKRAKEDEKEGKSPSTQAGEYVREEMHKLKRGGGRVKNPRQAIAIGLSEARRDGVAMPGPQKRGGTKKKAAAKKSSAKSARKSPSKRSNPSSRKKTAAKQSSAKKTA